MSGSNRLGIKGAIASLITVGTLCTSGLGQGVPACDDPDPKAGDCLTATPGIPGCTDQECCKLVCDTDPLCCLLEWDQACVDIALGICPIAVCDACGKPACLDCFVDHGGDSPFCNDECTGQECAGCCLTICAFDVYCCNVDWDGFCVDEAEQFCTCAPEDVPANDNCEDAIQIAEGVHAFTTVCSTHDGTDPTDGPCWDGFTGLAADVWFHYTATLTGPVRVHTCGGQADFNAKLAVYDGCVCPLTDDMLIECNDNGCGDGSEVIFEVVAGNCYTIRLGGGYLDPAGSGTFTVEPAGAPTNDDCANAIVMELGDTLGFNNTAATTDGSPIKDCPGDIDQDLWYSFTPTEDGDVRVATCGSSINTKLAVYQGCECPPSAEPIACNDDACGLQSELIFAGVAGQCYLIRVGSSPGEPGGAGQVTVAEPPPPPDSCDDPFDTEITQNTDNALIDTGGVSCQAGGVTVENSWARAYDLSLDLPGQAFSINCVEFAMNNSDSGFLVGTVTIYEDIDGGEPGSPGTDLVVLGSKAFTLPANTNLELFQASFDPPVVAPADSTIVVAIDLPPAFDGVAVYAGNSAGQSRCTYFLSEPCGNLTYTCTKDIGKFGDLHMLQTIRGDAGAPCPWDLDGGGFVGAGDLLLLLASWGNPYGAADLLDLLAAWGACP